MGIHPFYDAIFHQIVNNYNHYDVLSGNTSFSANTTNGTINYYKSISNLNYWTGVVDNSKLSNDNFYTLLPSDGYEKWENINVFNDYLKDEQNNFKIIWSTDNPKNTYQYTQQRISPYEYFSTITNSFEISTEYKKVMDLIGTFSPQILDEFERYFLEFASPLENVEIISNTFEPYTDSNNKYHEVKYQKFQTLLKEIVTIDKKTGDGDLDFYNVNSGMNLFFINDD